VHKDVAARLGAGDRVLDVGCGTGSLACLLAAKGCRVTGIDVSAAMLAQADQRLREAGLADRVFLHEIGAVDLDSAFDDASYDAVVSILVFSELSGGEMDYTLAQCHRILRADGYLMIADEVLPDSFAGRVGTLLLRLPFAFLAFALTQNTTHRVQGLRGRIEGAGFRVVDRSQYLGGTLRLYVAGKGRTTVGDGSEGRRVDDPRKGF